MYLLTLIVVIAPRVALEEIILWALEKEPVDCAAEGNVRPHDPVGINSLAEGMIVWEEDSERRSLLYVGSFPTRRNEGAQLQARRDRSQTSTSFSE